MQETKKRIVTLGGGSGSNAVLKGLATLSDVEVSALIAMSDDGGSTGVLRDEMAVQSVGDARQALAALAAGDEDIRRLFQYRFHDGPCKGHALGNIMLAAGEQLFGSFGAAVEALSRMLGTHGEVIGITNDNPRIIATRQDGSVVKGEGIIYTSSFPKGERLRIAFDRQTTLAPRARTVLQAADMIVLTPGTLYCTLIPVLMVEGMKEVLSKKEVPIVIVVNCLNKAGHTDGWTIRNYVDSLEAVMGRAFTHILVNSKQPNEQQMIQYDLHAHPELLITDDMGADTKVIRTPLISDDIVHKSSTDVLAEHRAFIRHDSLLVKEIIASLL